MNEKINIVGGGLAGSLMSIYLAKRGFNVNLYERRPDMRSGEYQGGRSINLAMSTRGINALEKVGLVEEIMAIAIPMGGRMMHSQQGETAYQPYGREDQAIYSVSRSQLNVKLLQLADKYPNINMFFDYKCIHADLENNVCTFIDNQGNEIKDSSDIIIASDGAFSAVREAMIKNPRYNFSQEYENYGYKELEIVPGPNNQFQMHENSLHIWPRTKFMMIALPNPGGNFTCTLFMPYEGTENSLNSLRSEADVLDFFNKEFGDAVPLMPNLTKDFFQNPTGHLATMRCYPWVKNKSVLIGDAAHAVVPFYGQGMNCSFEDCVVLDNLIEQHSGNWDLILNEFQLLRKPNADAIANLALQNFIEMRDLVGSPAFLRKKTIENKLVTKYSNYYKSQYERVTFSNDGYLDALNWGSKNDALLEKIISDNLESKLDDEAFMIDLISSMQ